MSATSDTATDRDRLIAIIRARSFEEGREIKLASGRTSRFYFNMKPTMLDPAGARLIGKLVLARLNGLDVDFVGGLEMGAVPVATAVTVMSDVAGRPLPAFFVRKEAKDHGTQSLVEGLAPGETLAGKRVAIVEDVTTTGGSALKAVTAVKAAGAEVVAVVTIVEREEGAAETFAEAGLTFLPVLTLGDFRTQA